MAPFIYTEKNGLHIIDLRKSVDLMKDAYNIVMKIAAEGGDILFVGTKKQAQNVIEETAKRIDTSYVKERWLGGTLTNFNVIRNSINKYNELCEQTEQEDFKDLPTKTQSQLLRQRDKMKKHFDGIQNMDKLPNLLYVIDVKREDIAIKEANLLEIPVVAVIDTNSDPEMIDYPIPANDDAIESIKLITNIIETAIVEGKKRFEEKQQIKEEVKAEAKEEE
jgi:small subunit ribosomal protein S2